MAEATFRKNPEGEQSRSHHRETFVNAIDVEIHRLKHLHKALDERLHDAVAEMRLSDPGIEQVGAACVLSDVIAEVIAKMVALQDQRCAAGMEEFSARQTAKAA